MSSKKKSKSIDITRIYNAPVKAVWDAWTDPKQVEKWWGPRGFTLTTHSKDLKPGGHWSYTMHGPDGTNYENKTLYHVVEKHKKLVYDHGGNDDRPPLFRVTVTFADYGQNQTRMDMSMELESVEAAEQTRIFVKKAGGNATWDRLGEHLSHTLFQKEQFIINRSFSAPIETLFQMWIQPEHVARWLPPTGMTMEYLDAKIQEGAISMYKMTDGKGMDLYGKIHYQQILAPERLVYTQEFCDSKGNPGKHPHLPVWPKTMQTTVLFQAEGPDETRVTVIWEPATDTSAAELEVFKNFRGSMTQGWTGSFDKLEELLT